MHITDNVYKTAHHIQLKIKLTTIVLIIHKHNQKYIQTHKPKITMELT